MLVATYTFPTCSNEPPHQRNNKPPGEHLPDNMCSRDTFIDQMNEIEALDGIKH